MTMDVLVKVNGNYVADVKINGEDAGTVGPGNAVEKRFYAPKGQKFEAEERDATEEEIAAANQAAG